MRLPDTAHTSRPWRIHEIAPDFELEDVWELPGRGGVGDFPLLAQLIASFDPSQGSRIARVLWKCAELLGWEGIGSRYMTLRDRLPADLAVFRRQGPGFTALPFVPLYLTDSEFAAEVANRTMHGVMHIGAVEDESGCFRAQMAVLIKPANRLGSAYITAIRPFRVHVVYPAGMRQGQMLWENLVGSRPSEKDAGPLLLESWPVAERP
jgi:hypothetical protein